MTNKQTKRILRTVLPVANIIPLYFVPWTLLWAWILPGNGLAQTQWKLLLSFLFLMCCTPGCREKTELAPASDPAAHIEYFGFTIIDTYWDDPTDLETKTNYADEVYSFSNVADMLVVYPTDKIDQRVLTFERYGMKAILHLHEIFFELTDTIAPSGANYDLREDYESRWDQFADINQVILTEKQIGAFYVGEEPGWNGITFEEMKVVTGLLKNQYPNIPILIIEAYPALSDFRVPETADWIGFDHYFVKDPNTDADFQREWQVLRSKLSDPSQKIMVIMDSHYIDWAHGAFGNIELEEMRDVAHNYYQLAKSDPAVIGMLGYFWPNGFDIPGSIGARGMPGAVKSEYLKIGKAITGKE